MIHEMELPKSLWIKTTNIVALLLNRTPTRVLHRKTQFQVTLVTKSIYKV